MNIRLHIAYDGGNYHGWQIQPEDRTVEGTLTEAAAQILNAEADEVKVQGASRTDSGVHAAGQVAHLECTEDRSLWDFARGLNALTPDDICINRVEAAPPDFHARFSAQGKLYRFEIWNHRFRHPLRHERSWKVKQRLDVEAMSRAAEMMVGRHDFAAFRAADCQSRSTERMMQRVAVHGQGNHVFVEVQGNAFLKYMVRVMVGTLVDVGRGHYGAERIEELLREGDRRRAGMTAPARGLTLVDVFYPDYPWEGGEPSIGTHWLPEG